MNIDSVLFVQQALFKQILIAFRVLKKKKEKKYPNGTINPNSNKIGNFIIVKFYRHKYNKPPIKIHSHHENFIIMKLK
jgi:hypothetical protein